MSTDNNNNNRPFKDFHGDVDSFLEHCSKIDANEINDDTILNHQELVDTIAEDYHVSKEEADKIAMEIKTEIVTDTIKDLVAKGILELKGYGEDGEAEYGLTEYGNQIYKNKS